MSEKARKCHYWRLIFWSRCCDNFVESFPQVGDYSQNGVHYLVFSFAYMKVRRIVHKIKVRGKHQKNVWCIKFICIIEGSKPTIFKSALSHFLIHLWYCEQSFNIVLRNGTVIIGGWYFDIIVAIILLNCLQE